MPYKLIISIILASLVFFYISLKFREIAKYRNRNSISRIFFLAKNYELPDLNWKTLQNHFPNLFLDLNWYVGDINDENEHVDDYRKFQDQMTRHHQLSGQLCCNVLKINSYTIFLKKKYIGFYLNSCLNHCYIFAKKMNYIRTFFMKNI